ncbi:sulfurase [Pararhodobacter marinus]|uniref:Sulfurase n=1 Tax=Pararhodobacter marinus TaxID=2184063 RepID=A0A2U2C5C5_9RHOB|nr:MOSC domain-containing protein [Pararhodobacter marinus]PWE27067.1 sulfurase [Pararhodobacter marinus]
MPALAKTRFEAEIVWLGIVPDRDAALESQPLERMELTFDGPAGETHGGMTRPSCSRVMGLYPRNTPIRNARQLSILSVEELDQIAAEMGLKTLNPALVGATMVIRGIPDFSHVPPSSRLLAGSGASVTVDMENRPCTLPARPIETAHPGFGKAFKGAARGRRGVTAWVEAEGAVALGDKLRLFVPDQPVWAEREIMNTE